MGGECACFSFAVSVNKMMTTNDGEIAVSCSCREFFRPAPKQLTNLLTNKAKLAYVMLSSSLNQYSALQQSVWSK